MNEELPSMLQRGEPARLFPVLAETSKEGRALSVLLACLGSIDDLAKTLLATVGQRVGARSRVHSFTEVVLEGSPEVRPDGMIVVETGRRAWATLVEAKVRRSPLQPEQVEAYLKLAKDNGIDALVTISNEFAAIPDHHPLKLARPPRGVGLFHWSWTSILTHAKILLAAKGVDDPEQRFLLAELVRFLEHPSTGVMRFDRMDGNWKDIVTSVVAGAPLSPGSDSVLETVANWHQECRDLALKLMEHVNANVAIKLPAAHRQDPQKRIADDAERLCSNSTLAVEFVVPDAASPISVEADLRTRSVQIAMTLRAPADRKSARARTNWLLRQLASSDPADLHVKAIYPGRRNAAQETLAAVRTEPDAIRSPRGALAPTTFEVRLVRDAGGRFSGAKTFIDVLEAMTLRFYAEVGQRLKSWQPTAPKMVEAPATAPASETSTQPESESSPSFAPAGHDGRIESNAPASTDQQPRWPAGSS